ncbi:MAG: hypothetical protein V4515_15215 [Chloroflexota bacterium]
MKPRQFTSEPIVPLKNGQPPQWVVACLDCGFAHDAHGRSAWDAIASVAPNHQADHKLIAREVNYTAESHPLYTG